MEFICFFDYVDFLFIDIDLGYVYGFGSVSLNGDWIILDFEFIKNNLSFEEINLLLLE